MNIVATLFNFGGMDTLIILIVVLVIFGPKKLPELARGLRQAMDEFNKAKHEVEHELTVTPTPPVQPAPVQQPRVAELPTAPPPAVTPTPQPAPGPVAQAPVEQTPPAGQA